MVTLLTVIFVCLLLLFIQACSESSDPVQTVDYTYSASGTYEYEEVDTPPYSGNISLTFESDDFPDNCRPNNGMGNQDFEGYSVVFTDSAMEWYTPLVASVAWSGDVTGDEITGTWEYTDANDNTFELTINSDGTFLLGGIDINCDVSATTSESL